MLALLVGLAIIALPFLAAWWADQALEARMFKEMDSRSNEQTKLAVERGLFLMRLHERRYELQAKLDQRRMELSTAQAAGPSRRQGRL